MFSKKMAQSKKIEDQELSLSANDERLADLNLHQATQNIVDNRFITSKLKKFKSDMMTQQNDNRRSTPDIHANCLNENTSVNDSQMHDFGPKTYSEKSLLSKGDFPLHDNNLSK